MKIQELPAAEVLRVLSTTAQGLPEEEARRRLQEYGPNELKEVRGVPLWRRFVAQFSHFLAIVLWLAAGLAFLSEYLQPGEGMLSLGVAIVAVIVVNAVFTFVQEYRAERAVAELKKLLPFQVTVLRDGVPRELPAREVVPGDVVLLEEGDKIPGDARLLTAHLLTVNNAPLTGESDPRPRNAEPFAGEYLESPNLVFAGTLVVSGRGTGVVLATGMATEFGKIAHLTGTVPPGVSPLKQEITRVSRLVSGLALLMGVLFFGLGHVLGREFWANFLFAVGIIVANVPEGLLPTVTLALAMGSQRLAKKQALVKDLAAVETLGAVSVICSDKTGTLTQNRMAVKRLWTPTSPAGEGDAAALAWKIAYFCNNARLQDGRAQGDPTEAALLLAAREALGDLAGERLLEIPFDSERKRMTTVHRVGDETLVFTKGALELLLPRVHRWQRGGSLEPLTQEHLQALQAAYHALMDEGLRVIALAWRPAAAGEDPRDTADPEAWERDLILAGLVGLEDPPRPEVPEAVARCRQAGIRILMITGDAGRTALAVAREIGLAGEGTRVVEGPHFRALSDLELSRLLSREEVIFARMTPRYKMRLVSLLQDMRERVAVTGDGVNDAPALKRADIGVAMGRVGTDVAREAADLVLLDDNFATIVRAVEEGRAVFDNIRKFISYIFASNIPEIVPYLAFVLFRLPLPLTIMQILAVDLGTDMMPALALGAEKPAPGVMCRPPRRPGERLVTPGLLVRAYLFLGPLEALAGMAGYFYVLGSGGWHWGEPLAASDPLYLTATTACLAGIIVTQVANVFACRSFRESAFTLGLTTNPLVLWGILTEVLLALLIIYHPWGQALFGTAALPWQVWLLLLPFALLLLTAEELRKLALRRFFSLKG
jgi:sodium/potassium-transporting ATPase subunit alpha